MFWGEELAGPADRLDVGPGREKGMKGNSRVLSLSSWVGWQECSMTWNVGD